MVKVLPTPIFAFHADESRRDFDDSVNEGGPAKPRPRSLVEKWPKCGIAVDSSIPTPLNPSPST